MSAIQDYSTKDGPGLRTTVFLKWCTLSCRWCSNPEAMLAVPELYFFPERIDDPDLALAENPGWLARDGSGWHVDRTTLPDADEVLERNTQRLFETVGEWWEPAECARRLRRDQAFYDASDGGVTFSGGEPMLQVEFVDQVQRLLPDGVHLAIDTAGDVPYASFERVLERTDLFLYDIKAADPDLHRRLTGVNNRRILDNARRLAADAREMWVRLVLVPGHNDLADDLRARLDLAAALGGTVTRVDLLGYHSLGVGKYQRLGRDYLPGRLPPVDEGLVELALTYAAELGLPIRYEPGLAA